MRRALPAARARGAGRRRVLGRARPHDRRAARRAHARRIARSAWRCASATSRSRWASPSSPLEGKLVVTAVNSESDAWWAGVRAGHDGGRASAASPRCRPTSALMAETRFDSTERSRHSARRCAASSPASPARRSRSPSSAPTARASTPRSRASSITSRARRSHRILPSGFGYLRLTQWTLGVTARRARARSTSCKDTPGHHHRPARQPRRLGARGERDARAASSPKHAELGRVDDAHRASRSRCSSARSRSSSSRTRCDGDADAYNGPVVDPGELRERQRAASSSPATMQAAGRAMVVGEPSCGCLLGFLGYARVPGGARARVQRGGLRAAQRQAHRGRRRDPRRHRCRSTLARPAA